MTQQVVWLCPHCHLPISFTCTLEHLTGTQYRVRAEPHITAHLKQHQ